MINVIKFLVTVVCKIFEQNEECKEDISRVGNCAQLSGKFVG